MLIEQIQSWQHVIFPAGCSAGRAGIRFCFFLTCAQLSKRWFSGKPRKVLTWQRSCINNLRLRPICEFLRRNGRPDRLRHRHAFPFQRLFVHAPLLGQLPLSDLQFSFEIGFAQSTAQLPFAQGCPKPPRPADYLANKMNWAQSRDQNQRGYINSHQENQRADGAKRGAKQATVLIGQAISDQATRSLNVHGHLQPEQVADVPYLVEACTRNDEQNDPWDSRRHTQPRMEQFRYAETE